MDITLDRLYVKIYNGWLQTVNDVMRYDVPELESPQECLFYVLMEGRVLTLKEVNTFINCPDDASDNLKAKFLAYSAMTFTDLGVVCKGLLQFIELVLKIAEFEDVPLIDEVELSNQPWMVTAFKYYMDFIL